MYEKPMALVNEEISEGVYAASGAVNVNGKTCYITAWENANMRKKWSGHWTFQVGWCHTNEEGSTKNNNHNCRGDIITLVFDKTVTFYDVWGYFEPVQDNSTTIKLRYNQDAMGNNTGDLHVDCASQPNLISVSVEHGA